MVKEFVKYTCSRCGSAFGYVQIKSKLWKCRKCNNEDPLETIEPHKLKGK